MATLNDKIDEILIDCERIHLPGGKWLDRKEAVDRIMKEIDKEHKTLRPSMKWFAGLMEEDLEKNDFKGGWLDGRLEYYWGKALHHLMALRPVSSVRIVGKKYAIERCFKAANYLMMFAHNLIEELRKGEKT